MKKIIVLLLCVCMFHWSYCEEKEGCCSIGNNLALLLAAAISGVMDGQSYEVTAGGQIVLESTLLQINDNSSLMGGLGVSLQGADYTESYETYPYGFGLKSAQLDGNEFSGKVALTYLIVPLLYNYTANNGFYGEIGLQPGFLLSAKDKYDDGGSNDYKDYVKGFDLGLPIGAGYNINEQLSVGARAVWGLTNFNDSGSSDKEHNYLIMGTIRYKFQKN